MAAVASAVGALLAVAAGPAAADGGGTLEEIVVTAQRREQNLQEVGIAVTAFGAEDVRNMGFGNTTDIAQMTPNLNYTLAQGDSSFVNFFLRGVGLNDFADAQENPVAVYVDDVYKPAMGGLALQLFDVQRIEVLRGPQGALFGRNSTGGVIHFVTRRPSRDFDAYADVAYGRFNEVKAEAAAGGPLSDLLMGRVSVAYDNHDGSTKNRTPGVQDFNSLDAIAGRAQLLFEPSDDLSVLLAGNYSRSKGAVGAWQHQASRPSDDHNTSLALGPDENYWGTCPGCDAFGYQDTDNNPWAGDYDRPGRVRGKNRSLQANINWKVGGVDVTAITAYTNVRRLQQEDTDMNPFLGAGQDLSFIAPNFAAETDTWTQELRFAGEGERFRWVTGGYYFHNKVDGHYSLNTDAIGFVRMDANYVQKTRSVDLFGQLEFDLSDTWTVIGGLRWTHEKKDLDFSNVDTSGITAFCSTEPDPIAAGCFNPVPTPLSPWRPTPDHMILFNKATVGSLAQQKHSYFTGRLQVNWKPADDLLVYGSYSHGKKSAGFNNGFLDTTLIFGNNPLDSIPFDSETLDAYEIGVKSTVLNDTTRLNAAAFYYDYKNFQTFQWLLINQVIFNTDAEVYGGELEIDSRPVDGLTLQGGLGVLHAVAKDIPTISGDGFRDREMVGAPDVSLSGLVRYEWPALGGKLALQASGTYQKDIWYDIQNHPISRENGYTVVNFRGSYTGGDGAWEIYAWLNNAFKEKYKTYTFDFSGSFGFNQIGSGAPRWWGVGMRVNFGKSR